MYDLLVYSCGVVYLWDDPGQEASPTGPGGDVGMYDLAILGPQVWNTQAPARSTEHAPRMAQVRTAAL